MCPRRYVLIPVLAPIPPHSVCIGLAILGLGTLLAVFQPERSAVGGGACLLGCGREVATTAVSFSGCPSDTQIPVRLSHRDPGYLNLGSWTLEESSRRLLEWDSTARCRLRPTAEFPKCRWPPARAGQRGGDRSCLEQRGNGSKAGVGWPQGSDFSRWQCECTPEAPTSPACPKGAGECPADTLACSPLGSPGFWQPAADIRAPLRSSPFTTADPRLCAAPPSPAPAPRVPTPCRGCRRRRRVRVTAPDPRVVWKESASGGTGELWVGVGVVREKAGKGQRSLLLCREQLGPPF